MANDGEMGVEKTVSLRHLKKKKAPFEEPPKHNEV